jgi:uncharacterized protein YbjQ (UPF0145 family)
MIISTTNEVPGKTVKESMGIVIGNTIRAKHIGKDIGAGLRSLVGGELKGYTDMLSEARSEALKRMIQDAKKKGADGVIGVRLATASVMAGSAEILAYGTAVKLK